MKKMTIIIIVVLLYFHQGKNKIIPCFNPNTLLPGEHKPVCSHSHNEYMK